MRRLAVLILLSLLLVGCGAQVPQPTPTPQPNSVTIARDYLVQMAQQPKQDAAAVAALRPTLPPTFTPTPKPAELTPTFTDSPSDLPTQKSTQTATSTASPLLAATASSTPFTERASVSIVGGYEQGEMLALLEDTPSVHIPDLAHLRRIYAVGQARQLRSDFMLGVGDCNTESRFFLRPMVDETSSDGVADLYLSRSDVQDLVSYYEPTFDHKGQSANSGFNALSVMDPLWTRSSACLSGESPLACDIREHQPFAMMIMFGANDVLVLNTEGYELAVRDIIEYSLEQGVIPILSTFPFRLDGRDGTANFGKAVRLNAILRLLADEYQIPIVNLWDEVRDLPDKGILPDNAHMTVEGFEIRNELSLEVLRYLRENVIQPAEGESDI